MNIRIPTARHIGEKAKERRDRKENQNSNIPTMEPKVIHPMTMAKEKADKTEEQPASSRLRHPHSLPMPVGQIKIGIHPGIGVNKAGTHLKHKISDDGIP